MKIFNFYTLIISALLITACNTVKKTSAAPVAESSKQVQPTEVKTSPDPPASAPAVNFGPIVTKPSGVRPPGEAELTAIKLKYQDVTMQTLIDGHSLYVGVCTNCHEAKDIYSRDLELWPGIIDEMALHAELTGVEKDATLKYVIAMKSTQPEWVKY